MRFIDEAKIKVSGGHGGPGSVSFRRETFIPRGGPDGGDGGEGGSVIFVASSQLGSLQDFRYKRSYQAENGHHGSGTNKAGRDGEDVLLKVPVGTIIKDTKTGEVLIDFANDGQEWIACKGGRGGKGNAHFTTSTHQAPRFAQPGEEGEAREITLELKLLADVGIIGFPNAGKSTLISRISAARPKIADYAFTTLTPNLGVVSLPDYSTFVVADIPGLVEGAHRGLGLGHKFLKHIERTAVFVHLLDGTQLLEDATRPDVEDSFKEAIEKLIHRYQAIRNELGLFNEKLLHKPEIVVLNKVDLLQADAELVERARTELRQRIASIRGTHPIANEPFVVSAVSGTGVQELVYAISGELKNYRELTLKTPKRAILPDDQEIRS
jgi:GTP-binding protein